MPETPNSSLPLVQRAPLATRRRFRLLRRLAALLLFSFLIWFIASTWSVVRAPVVKQVPPLVVNDVSQLNPIQVSEVITPTTTTEIVSAVQRHSGPIATPEQFRRAYPRAAEFLALKRRLDPTNKFRNELLDKYLYPR